MNKNILAIIAVIAVCVGLISIIYYNRDNPPVVETPAADDTSVPENTSITYKNAQYGFTFSLPSKWQGYYIVETTWQGAALTNGFATSGPKILIRNPKWTAAAPYEDLPVMIFTISQWKAYLAEDFSVSAAPIKASELARNSEYVFALPPRWDFDYSLEYKEAQDIIAEKPLKTFEVVKADMSQGKLNIGVVCEQALIYMTFADAKSAEVFVADCKAGKHPEVVEKYKADLNLGAGVAI
jgi:hypothetical protein